MKITHAKRLALNIPFYAAHVDAAMHRANTHDERVWVYRLETDNGLVAYGDGGFHEVDGLVGRNPFSLIRDDSIGFGPQMAVLDLCGKDAGVPVHALLGSKLRNRCPISWWDIDMPPEDWAKEAKESVKRGYTSFKMKARPWRDIITQVETVGKVVPADYKFDVDFNGFLLNQAKAEEILSQLDEHRNVGIYESPFWLARDPEGAKLLKSRIRKPVAEHFQEPVLHDRTSDAFVIGGCAGDTTRHGTLAASFNKPFWLQMVGTGLTTTFAGHIGSVLSHAQLPYITCHELWRDDLVTRPVKVVDGYMDVPDGPGLGVEADEKAIEKYTVDPKEITGTQKYRAQKRILRVVWPGAGKNGRVWEFTDEMVYQPEFYKGNLPGFERGVHLEIEEDDKSAAFRKAHARLLEREALTVRG